MRYPEFDCLQSHDVDIEEPDGNVRRPIVHENSTLPWSPSGLSTYFAELCRRVASELS
jgi:hypothetical protein